MSEQIDIKRDESCEQLAKIQVESCNAFLEEDDMLVVMGELSTTAGSPVNESRSLQITVYDAENRIVGREEEYFNKFGLRQSFRVDIDLPSRKSKPKTIRVFPTVED